MIQKIKEINSIFDKAKLYEEIYGKDKEIRKIGLTIGLMMSIKFGLTNYIMMVLIELFNSTNHTVLAITLLLIWVLISIVNIKNLIWAFSVEGRLYELKYNIIQK